MTEVFADTAQGTLRGRRQNGLALFAGVPFAAPPVGELRLAPPQPAEGGSGVRDALTLPPAPARGPSALRAGDEDPAPMAVATTPPASHFAAHLAAVQDAARSSSEDCLYLNVWAPDHSHSRPVLVYLYGGGFDAGSASPPLTNGAELARALDCIVVTVNYRVGA